LLKLIKSLILFFSIVWTDSDYVCVEKWWGNVTKKSKFDITKCVSH